jgi:hypothetical protein
MDGNHWLLEVIKDLKTFTLENEMTKSADMLDEILWTAMEELDEKELLEVAKQIRWAGQISPNSNIH